MGWLGLLRPVRLGFMVGLVLVGLYLKGVHVQPPPAKKITPLAPELSIDLTSAELACVCVGHDRELCKNG